MNNNEIVQAPTESSAWNRGDNFVSAPIGPQPLLQSATKYYKVQNTPIRTFWGA